MRLPVVLITICYIVLIATDLLIIRDLRTLSLNRKVASEPKKGGRWWKVFTVFGILTLALLTVAVCMPKRNVHTGVTPTMWMLFIVLTIEISQIIYCIFSLAGFLPMIWKGRRWNTGLWIGLPLAVLFFSMLWWGVLIGRYQIQTNEVDIYSPRLPEGFDGYKIAQISDLHVGTWGTDTTFLSHLVDKVNDQKPDLIVFTGDIVNRLSDELTPFTNVLSRLKAPDGVLTILGNHDYGDYVTWDSEVEKVKNLSNLKNYEKQMGWRLLDNSHAIIKKENGDSIVVIGVGNWGEPPFSQYGNLKKAYPEKSLNDKNFKVLLSHNPEHWNREVSHISNIDLTLSGHTHAMQVMFAFGSLHWSPSQYRYEQWGGLYTRKNKEGVATNVYVNIGAGEVGIPLRIGATPEITVFNLRREK